ncbi:MAG: hypothetical protein NZ898_04950 [Myxococcota bacterium]|nr:hypothetical protein [Myxococcota bacterium]MDW8362878.1 hypothetical protein [Myxococcales bacterium]
MRGSIRDEMRPFIVRIAARRFGPTAVASASSLLLLLAMGCGDSNSDGARDASGPRDAQPEDASTPADGDAPPGDCERPATSCPDLQPLLGGPCRGELTCSYRDPNGVDTWSYRCVDGAWQGEPTCLTRAGCPVPPLVEACRDPFEGTVAGATVRIGKPGPGPLVPFADGERVEPVWGGQGLPMVALRIEVTGADEVACTRLRTRFTLDGEDSPEIPGTVTLRCGRSLDVQVIVPYDIACEERLFDFVLRVALDGIGEARARLTMMGGVRCTG